MPLKRPNPMDEMARYNQNDFTRKAFFNPSSIKARTSCPGGQGGVAGFSRAKKRKSSEEKAVTAPKINCTSGMLIVSVRMGVKTIPSAVPTRLERVIKPTAVARSSMANQLAGTFVHAFKRKG